MGREAGTVLPEGGYSIQDAAVRGKLRAIFEKFSLATGLTADLLDPAGENTLIAAGRREFCGKFHEACPASADLCRVNCLRPGPRGESALETCTHGLAYCGAPVLVNGRHTASLVAGRVLLREPDRESFRRQAALYGFDEAEYLGALVEVPVLPEEKLRSAAACLAELASFALEQSGAALERDRIAGELQLSERKFRDLTETIPDLVWELDENGACSYISPRITELLGYEAGEVAGKSPFGFVPGDEEEAAAEEFRLRLRQKAPFRNIEYPGRHKDGRRRLLEASGNPFFDGEGRYQGCRGVTRDITARKLLEDENRVKALLLDSVKDAVFLHDTEGRIVYANEAAYVQTGRTEEEMLNAMFQRLLTPEAAKKFDGQTKYALEHGKAVFESELLRADGGPMPVETHAHALELDGENFILRVVMDITEWKEAEDEQRQLMRELERTNSEISQFNSLIAHDLQAPLRMVAGYAQQLRKRLAGKLDRTAETFLDYILNGAGLMQEMLDGLLHYLREGAKPEALRKVDMDKVAGQALLLLKPAIEENGAAVSCGRLPVVAADRSQMLHLLQNLIGNAVKFRGLEAPRISVSCVSGGPEHVFTVKDNGIGIPPLALERVFKIFQRLHTREKYPGTGLGLALCRKIVENHGGRIWAESGPGKGSAFHFTLPKRETPPAAEPTT